MTALGKTRPAIKTRKMAGGAASKPAKAATTRRALKSDVIQLRTTADDKALMLRAAELDGRTLSEFVLETARREATDRILEQRDLVYSPEGFAAMLDILDNPPPLDPKVLERFARKAPWED